MGSYSAPVIISAKIHTFVAYMKADARNKFQNVFKPKNSRLYACESQRACDTTQPNSMLRPWERRLIRGFEAKQGISNGKNTMYHIKY